MMLMVNVLIEQTENRYTFLKMKSVLSTCVHLIPSHLQYLNQHLLFKDGSPFNLIKINLFDERMLFDKFGRILSVFFLTDIYSTILK